MGVSVLVVALGVTLTILVGGRANAAPTISANEAWSHVGQEVAVKFLVRSTDLQGGREFLNSLGESVHQYAFAAALSNSVVHQLAYDPADYDFGHTVSVEGVVRIVHGRPEVLVTAPAQISARNPEGQ
jgi:hypothetical protein